MCCGTKRKNSINTKNTAPFRGFFVAKTDVIIFAIDEQIYKKLNKM